MRRKEKRITDPERIETVFKKGIICRLALIDDGEPYIVPLNYGYRNGTLYFHSATEGRKVNILRKNPHVAFEIETDVELASAGDACGWGCRFRSLMGTGTVEFLDDPADRREALTILMEHQTGRGGWSFPDAMLAKTLCFRLVPDSVSGKFSGYGELS